MTPPLPRDEIARAAGYPSWADAIRATADMTTAAAAAALGVGVATLWDARKALGLPTGKDRARERRARAAGYPSWADAIRATAAMPTTQVAAAMNVHPVTIRRWRAQVTGTSSAQAAHDGIARRAGHPSWEGAIRATAHLTLAAAASALGVSVTAIRHARATLGIPSTRNHGLERRARAAGHPTWEHAIRATADMTTAAAAAHLHASPATVRAWRAELRTGSRTASACAARVAALGYASWEDAIRATAHLTTADAAAHLHAAVHAVVHARRVHGVVKPRAVNADVVARRAGHPSWEDAIRATLRMPGTEAAAHLGVPQTRVYEARKHLGVTRRDARARAAGYPSWEDAIRATADMTTAAAARALGCTSGTLVDWRRRLGIGR